MSGVPSPERGLLLFAHGARDASWAAPFEAVLARVRALRSDTPVALAFLELMPPDLATAAAQLAQRGCRQVDVVPLFLGTGGHVRRDVPQLLQRLHALHPGTRWTLHEPVGEHPDVIEAIARTAAASVPQDETTTPIGPPDAP
ncbi:MAG TPA: CbiX/SirB N-terminal domain-containing protein [Burkholderiaceae bacterium]